MATKLNAETRQLLRQAISNARKERIQDVLRREQMIEKYWERPMKERIEELLDKGLSNADIVRKLDCSPSVVKEIKSQYISTPNRFGNKRGKSTKIC